MVTYGFFNSANGDRKYTAEQMSQIFDFLINDGVLETYGDKFFTTPATSGLGVVLGSGWAWFDQTWTMNDSSIPLALDEPDPSLSRIDTVCLVVNKSQLGRMNTFQVFKGLPSLSPQPAELQNTSTIIAHPLAYVTVPADASTISSTNIEILVGKTKAPFITSILQTTDITTLFAGWTEQYNIAYSGWNSNFHTSITGWEAEFRTWFEHLQTYLSEDVVTNLQYQIEQLKKADTDNMTAVDNKLALKVNTSDKATTTNAQAGTDDTKWMTPLKVKQAISYNVEQNMPRSAYILSAIPIIDELISLGISPYTSFGDQSVETSQYYYSLSCVNNDGDGNLIEFNKTTGKPIKVRSANGYGTQIRYGIFLGNKNTSNMWVAYSGTLYKLSLSTSSVSMTVENTTSGQTYTEFINNTYIGLTRVSGSLSAGYLKPMYKKLSASSFTTAPSNIAPGNSGTYVEHKDLVIGSYIFMISVNDASGRLDVVRFSMDTGSASTIISNTMIPNVGSLSTSTRISISAFTDGTYIFLRAFNTTIGVDRLGRLATTGSSFTWVNTPFSTLYGSSNRYSTLPYGFFCALSDGSYGVMNSSMTVTKITGPFTSASRGAYSPDGRYYISASLTSQSPSMINDMMYSQITLIDLSTKKSYLCVDTMTIKIGTTDRLSGFLVLPNGMVYSKYSKLNILTTRSKISIVETFGSSI